MSVTQVKQALGSWSLRLRPDTPRQLLDAIAEFGHVAVLPGDISVAQTGDNLLTAARYVGVVRKRGADESGVTEIGGAGLEFWLGDEDGKGAVRTSAVTLSASTFASTIRALLPSSGSITEGTLYSVPGTYTGSHVYEDPRTSITYVTDTFGTTTYPVSWRVNGNGTLDAGRDVDLFVSTPQAILVRREDAGRDMFLTGMAGSMSLDRDVEDYTTSVVLIAEGEGAATVTASASLVTPYRDLKGNNVVLTRLVSEFETDATNAPARAQLQLNRFTNPRFAVNLSTDEYDVKGTFAVGDTIYVYDPDIGFSDTNNQVQFRGQLLNPKALRVSEMTYPVGPDWTVAYRDQSGNWFDLSDYYVPESGSTTVVVGEFSRAINDSTSQPVGSRPVGDSTVPGVPTFGATSTSSYQSDNTGSGQTFAQIQLTWTQPNNVDGSTITDGDHYEIRYRPTGSVITASWSATSVPWGVTAHLITGLNPGTSYDFQIAAVDGAVPPNRSAWSSTLAVVSSVDTVAPSAPAAPTVAASRIAIQVTHTLGKSSGGTYNLEVDLDRFEVHVGASASFTPDNTNLVGKLPATVANIRGTIPAVGTFPVESTNAVWTKVVAVDTAGNKSTASVGASATALLIDNAHISDLTVSKVTAGTIGATWIQGGTLTTATSGARVELAGSGLNAYNSAGTKTVEIKGSDGSATVTGRFRTGFVGGGQPYLDIRDSADRTTITMYNATESNYAFINSPQVVSASTVPTLGMNSGIFPNTGIDYRQRLWLAGPNGILLDHRVEGTGQVYGPSLNIQIGSGRFGNYFSTGDQTGGMLYIDQNFAILERNGAGVNNGGRVVLAIGEASMATYNTGTKSAQVLLDDSSNISFFGRFKPDDTNSGNSALFCGSFNPGSAAAITVNYGVTMATAPRVLYSYQSLSNANHRVSAAGTTSFTVSYSATVDSVLNYWCFRTT